MHFFHPIQQCAQQIYHTALPLSPTSSSLQNSCLQNVADDQLSHVTAFIGAPSTWGLLLRTIDIRPRELICIATSGQGIIAACKDIVNIYDAVTGVLKVKQFLYPPEPVTKIQASPDGSTLFFAHPSSVTMWDVQTGGLIHIFTTQSLVNDIAVSASEGYIACGLSDGSVAFWNIRTKGKGRGFGNGQPVVAICWLSPQKLAVATHNSLYIHDVAAGKTVDSLLIPDRVWGMLYFGEKHEFLVGMDEHVDRGLCSLEAISHRYPGLVLGERQSTENRGRLVRRKLYRGRWSSTYPGQLTRPTLVGNNIACINPPIGVQLFDTNSYDWTHSPPLLDVAESVAVSLNRNLVAQTKDSIQIFSTDVLMSGEARNDQRVSHIYPMGGSYIVCVLQPTRHLAILELETLRELHRNDKTLPFGSLLTKKFQTFCSLISRGVNTSLDIPAAVWAWRLGNPLPKGIKAVGQDKSWSLYGLSPACTRTAIVNTESHLRELLIYDTECGEILASPLLEGSGLGEACDLIFDSKTRFYLEIEGPRNIRIPYDITASSHPCYQYTITKGEAMEIRTRTPYTLDANCEWVLDAQSRKICWISPENLRRGKGGHFWVGPSLFMVGGDGVARKVSFREPDC